MSFSGLYNSLPVSKMRYVNNELYKIFWEIFNNLPVIMVLSSATFILLQKAYSPVDY